MGVRVQEKPKGSGRWYVVATKAGKRKARFVGSRQSAQKVAEIIRAKLALGEAWEDHQEERDPFTFGELASLWMKEYVKISLSENTRRGYESILRVHLMPEFGRMGLELITPPRVRKFLARKHGEGMSIARARRLIACLSSIFSFGAADELIQNNPASGMLKFFSSKDVNSYTPDPLTKQELQRYLACAQAYYPRYFPLLLFLARTGARRGEALALKWDDIDWSRHTVRLRRSVTEKGHFAGTKSGKERTVSLSPQLTDVLWRHRNMKQTEGFAGHDDLVFGSREGTPLNGANLWNRVHKPILEKEGLPHVRIHDLRHSYATQRIEKGHNLADISKSLGHASINITIKIYYHHIPEASAGEIAELDD